MALNRLLWGALAMPFVAMSLLMLFVSKLKKPLSAPLGLITAFKVDLKFMPLRAPSLGGANKDLHDNKD
jgi:hypothetical protein